MASIDKYNGRWRARWRTPDGKSRSESFDRKIDAERKLTSVEHAKLTGSYVDPSAGRMRFGKWWDTYVATTVNLRASTRARDESYARNHILPAFKDLSLSSIDHALAQQWVADLVAKGLAPATVVKTAQIAGKAMRAAVRSKLVTHDPFAELQLPRVEREEMRFLTPAEVANLADTIDERYRAFVLLGAYGGLRLGEMAGLRRGRLDLLKRRVEVTEILIEVRGHHVTGPPKTRAGRRSLPIPRVAANALEEHAAGLPIDALVFTAPEGGPMRASQFRQRVWTPACVAAGLGTWTHADAERMRRYEETGKRVGHGWHYDGLRIHDLRHTAVAFWIAAGASPLEVARRAGHASVVTVLDRYGHLLPGSEDAVTDALDALAMSSTATASILAIRR